MLTTQLPDRDRALIGRPAILAFLHHDLGLRRPNGKPLSWRMVLRFRRDLSLPLLRGFSCLKSHRSYPLSTRFALSAWLLSQFSSADAPTFRVAPTQPLTTGVGSPNDLAA